jgi:hypothetical protein
MPKIKRHLMAHYIDSSITGTAAYERLGKGIEELTVDMNANVNTVRDITGTADTNIDGYEPSFAVEPYVADSGSGMFTRLQSIIDERKTLDDLKTTVVEVHTWEEPETGAYPAYREDAIIEVVSYGGDVTAYQIPFNVHLVGNRVAGTFNPTTKAFTAGS